MIPQVLKVTNKLEEMPGTYTFQFAHIDKSPMPNFTPGQFNMLFSFGKGEIPISISGGSSNNSEWTHTIRSVGLISQALSDLKVGDNLGMRGPFGQGWPEEQIEKQHLALVAGGLGLAPLRPVVHQFLKGDIKPASLTLYYGARGPQQILYQKEIEQWSKVFPVHLTVDHADREWKGEVGLVTKLLKPISLNRDKTRVFVCGPEIMMKLTINELISRGIEKHLIHLSMERNMKCATGLCGHCQWGPEFICKNGPVFQYSEVEKWFHISHL